MRTILSSEALPFASPEDLANACRRRALAGLEVSSTDVLTAASVRYEHALPTPWVHFGDRATSEDVVTAEMLGAGMLITTPFEPIPETVPLALVHGTDVREATSAAEWAREVGASTAWQLRQQVVRKSEVDGVLSITRDTLAHVRLLGSGPEPGADDVAMAHLMVELALSGYAGTIALTPSQGADLQKWRRWLFKGRSWGCGTVHEKQLGRQGRPSIAGRRTRGLQL